MNIDPPDVVRLIVVAAALVGLVFWVLLWRRDHRRMTADLQLGLMSTAGFLVAVVWGLLEQIAQDVEGGSRIGMTTLATGWAVIALVLSWRHEGGYLSR